MKIKTIILRKQPLTPTKVHGILSRFTLEKHQSNYMIIKIDVEVDKTHTIVLCDQIAINYKNRADTKNVRNILKSNFINIFKKDSVNANKVIITYIYSNELFNNEFNKDKNLLNIQQIQMKIRKELESKIG